MKTHGIAVFFMEFSPGEEPFPVTGRILFKKGFPASVRKRGRIPGTGLGNAAGFGKNPAPLNHLLSIINLPDPLF
jgi:hypothetical protein